MNIWLTEYLSMNGRYQAIVIAKTEWQAKNLFAEYFGKDDWDHYEVSENHATAILMGKAASKVEKVVLAKHI